MNSYCINGHSYDQYGNHERGCRAYGDRPCPESVSDDDDEAEQPEPRKEGE